MNPIQNPFSPGAGSPPPDLVGRDEILEQARILLGRVAAGKSEKSIVMVGLRGVGKTVLLNEILRMAKDADYLTITMEAHENQALASLLVPGLRGVLFELDRLAGLSTRVKKGLGVLQSFVSAIKVKIADIEVGLDIEPLKGTADSGRLEVDLPSLFEAVGEAAQDKNKAVAIFLDEIQYLSKEELSALIMAMHRMQQRQLPIVLLGAGLKVLTTLAGESKSYAERLFMFPEIGALADADARKALHDPIERAGAGIEAPALEEIVRRTQGYPYFLQEWGYQAWNQAPRSPITLNDVQTATASVVQRLDANFFRIRFDRLTANEKHFLRTMAGLGTGPYRSGDMAEALGTTLQAIAPVRAKLIAKGMIYSPAHGILDFTVPLFDEFMRRTMPDAGE
ncbi:MAG: AAA family ATPase [Gammaproteobacteria bacterium RBG_16_57_12]|nr:MAG: AAA family ATPase [Gammaproteobacteria bacterium RBG_16_57_12]